MRRRGARNRTPPIPPRGEATEISRGGGANDPTRAEARVSTASSASLRSPRRPRTRAGGAEAAAASRRPLFRRRRRRTNPRGRRAVVVGLVDSFRGAAQYPRRSGRHTDASRRVRRTMHARAAGEIASSAGGAWRTSRASEGATAAARAPRRARIGARGRQPRGRSASSRSLVRARVASSAVARAIVASSADAAERPARFPGASGASGRRTVVGTVRERRSASFASGARSTRCARRPHLRRDAGGGGG